MISMSRDLFHYVTLGNVESQKFLRTEKNRNNLIWVACKNMHTSMHICDIELLSMDSLDSNSKKVS